MFAGRLAKVMSPRTRVYVAAAGVETLPELALEPPCCIVLATDNFPAEIEAGRRAHCFGHRLLQAGVDGATLVARVRLLQNADAAASSCLGCAYSAREWRACASAQRFFCEVVPDMSGASPVIPTASTSSLCSVAADPAALELLKGVLSLGAAAGHVLIEYSGCLNRITTSPLRPAPDCPCEHVRYERVDPPRPLAECRLGELASVAQTGADPEAVSYAVGDEL